MLLALVRSTCLRSAVSTVEVHQEDVRENLDALFPGSILIVDLFIRNAAQSKQLREGEGKKIENVIHKSPQKEKRVY